MSNAASNLLMWPASSASVEPLPSNVIAAHVILAVNAYKTHLRRLDDSMFICEFDLQRGFAFREARSDDLSERLRHAALMKESKRRMTADEFEHLTRGFVL